MWRFFFLLFSFVCYMCSLSAQPKNNFVAPAPARIHTSYSVVDRADWRIAYALNADDLQDLSTYIDLQYLEIGKQISKYYSAFLSSSDSLTEVYVKKHPTVGHPMGRGEIGKKASWWSEYQYTEIFRSGDEMTLYCRMPWFFEKQNCQYTEPYPQQNWMLQSDTLTICGQLCQKSVCTFRGRDFEAWFAPGIPISEGPWTFGGLPGLIMKVYDKDHLYVFECVRIEQGSFPIKKYDYSTFKPIKREKVLKLQRVLNEDYFEHAQWRDENTMEIMSNFKPYEPLELE